MTTNDAQIDVLLRRYARGSQAVPATEHLDADELNAFAEGLLPAAARARYVSHLADCDNCRQIVSQLAISSGAMVAEPITAPAASGSAWWKRLSGFFSPLTLRYAAFAMVLIAAAGIVFLVTRRPSDSNLVARNVRTNPATASAAKPAEDAAPQTGSTSPSVGTENRQALPAQPGSSSQPSPSSDQIAKLDDKTRTDSPTLPPKPAKEADVITNPALAANKKGEATEAAPSYAPPPPAPAQQQSQMQAREQQRVGGPSVYAARKTAEPTDSLKQMDRGRGGEAGKDASKEDDSRMMQNQAQSIRRSSDEKVKGPRRDVDNNMAMNRSANDAPATASKALGNADRAASEEKAPETRSAGGRKFKRQGSAWVDTKFKTSISLKNISRGSSDYAALDAGLRAIAQQLGGEVIVVWKGKGYLIK
jgi:hypothetical protein